MTTLERLKEQANLYTDVSGRWSNAVGVEKMIELVVLECMKVAHYHTPDTEECEYSWLIHDKIKEHFGIE